MRQIVKLIRKWTKPSFNVYCTHVCVVLIACVYNDYYYNYPSIVIIITAYSRGGLEPIPATLRQTRARPWTKQIDFGAGFGYSSPKLGWFPTEIRSSKCRVLR